MANRVWELLIVDWLHDRNITKSNGNWHQKRKEFWIFLAITTKNGMNLLNLSWATNQCCNYFMIMIWWLRMIMPMCILSPFMNKCKRWSWGHWNLKWKVEWVEEGKDAHSLHLSQKQTMQVQENVQWFFFFLRVQCHDLLEPQFGHQGFLFVTLQVDYDTTT